MSVPTFVTTFVTTRNEIYYFRYRVPKRIQALGFPTEIVKSLRTRDILEAQSLVLPKLSLIQRIRRCLDLTTLSTLFNDLSSFEWSSTQFTVEPEILTPSPKPDSSSISSKKTCEELTLSTLYKEFLEYKIGCEGLSDRIVKEYERMMRTILEFSEDRSLGRINRQFIREILITYSKLPVRNKKRYKDLPVSELLKMDIPDSDKVSAKTVGQVRRLLHGVFSYAVENSYLETSPAVNVKLPTTAKTVTYSPYKDAEIHQFEKGIKRSKVNDWQRWLTLLAIYTGCRRGELIQLRKQDVKRDKGSGRYYLDITEDAGPLKTAASIRRVPISRMLEKTGFISFVESVSAERLFDGVKPYSITGWFGRFRKQLGVPCVDEAGNKKVFHSFRHSFISKARTRGVSDQLLKAVVGHETQCSITDRYTHFDHCSITDLCAVVDVISY